LDFAIKVYVYSKDYFRYFLDAYFLDDVKNCPRSTTQNLSFLRHVSSCYSVRLFINKAAKRSSYYEIAKTLRGTYLFLQRYVTSVDAVYLHRHTEIYLQNIFMQNIANGSLILHTSWLYAVYFIIKDAILHTKEEYLIDEIILFLRFGIILHSWKKSKICPEYQTVGRSWNQGCQMAYFQTKIFNYDILLKALEWNILGIF
jgi:hypothetical protein